MFFTKLFKEFEDLLKFMLSTIFAEVTSTLRNYYKEVIVINCSFAGKSPYSCQKLNGKQEIKN